MVNDDQICVKDLIQYADIDTKQDEFDNIQISHQESTDKIINNKVKIPILKERFKTSQPNNQEHGGKYTHDKILAQQAPLEALKLMIRIDMDDAEDMKVKNK